MPRNQKEKRCAARDARRMFFFFFSFRTDLLSGLRRAIGTPRHRRLLGGTVSWPGNPTRVNPLIGPKRLFLTLHWPLALCYLSVASAHSQHCSASYPKRRPRQVSQNPSSLPTRAHCLISSPVTIRGPGFAKNRQVSACRIMTRNNGLDPSDWLLGSLQIQDTSAAGHACL